MFIAVCMVLIAGSIGAVLYLAAGINGLVSALAALAALVGMMLYNVVANRLRDRSELGDQIADLSRGTADLARQVAEIGRRLGTMETRVDSTVNRARGAVDPLAAEIGELGGLVKQLAQTVAAHEAELHNRAKAMAEMAEAATPIGTLITPGAPPTLDAAPTPVASVSPAPAEVEPGELDLTEKDAVDGTRRFRGMSRENIVALIGSAVDANRIDLYLQPIVTLPQRKVRYYEALSRLRTDDGDVVPAADFIEFAESSGSMPKIDNLLLFRCVQVLRRLQLKNRDVGLFCNVNGTTLSDAAYFQQFLEFMEANRALAPTLMFEFTQAAYRSFGPLEHESLAALAERGFRFSMDHVTDLRMEPKELADRSFRFFKVPAKLLLNRAIAGQSDIHPADLADLLARSGIDLIAERIESENMVVDLLDHDVRFGQGFLFSPPRPVRAEALQGVADGGKTTGGARTPGQPPSMLVSESVGSR
jgi:cyclic-di-GMP phosphodiesterase TipF (flagellum assembly factor)